MPAYEVEALVEQYYIERSRGNAVMALRQAISDALVDGIESRLRLEAAERAASREFMRQLPAAAS
jgi:hypothetical protein